MQAEQLQQANAMLSLSRSVAAVAGPALAGLLVATAGPASSLHWTQERSASRVSRSRFFAFSSPVHEVPRSAVLADLRDGWRELTARTWVWTCIVYFSVSNVAVAPLFVLGPFVAERRWAATAWGLIVTCGGIGSVLGDVVALRFRPSRALLPGYLALATWGLEPALLARPFPTAAVAGAAALGFGALSFSNALWFTALQERIPRGSISRVSAYDWLGSRAFQPLGYALAGPAGAAIGVPATLVHGCATRLGERRRRTRPGGAAAPDHTRSARSGVAGWPALGAPLAPGREVGLRKEVRAMTAFMPNSGGGPRA